MKPLYQEAYEKGSRLREETLQNIAPDHQKRIEAYWKNAVTDWIASEKAFSEPIDSYTYHDHLRRHGRAPEQTGDFCLESVFTVHNRSAAFPYRMSFAWMTIPAAILSGFWPCILTGRRNRLRKKSKPAVKRFPVKEWVRKKAGMN